MKNAQCAETNEKNEFFAIFSFCVKNVTSLLKIKLSYKKMRNVLKRIYVFLRQLCDFQFLYIVHYVLNIRSVLVWDLDESRIFYVKGALRP